MKKILFTLILFVSISTLIKAQVPSYVPTDSLVGWWPFNGNANNANGNGFNGTNNGATLTNDRYGIPNSAYLFDGVYNYISVPPPSFANKISISFWLYDLGGYPNSFAINPRYISGEYCNGGFTFWKNYANSPQGWCFNRSRMVPPDIFTLITTSDSVWNHICMTYDGSTFKFYVNSVLLYNTSYSGNIIIGSNLFFGKSGCGNETIKGKMDDIGIWNRALTSTEVANLFVLCSDTITNQPTNQIGLKGGSKNFSITHSGTNINYQWQSNSVALGWQNVPNANQYSGATTNNLSISNLSVSNHNQLFRVVSNKTGCAADTSVIAKLTISNLATDSARLVKLQGDSARLTLDSIQYLARINKLAQDSGVFFNHIVKLSNDSVVYVNRIYKLSNDSVFYVNRIVKLSNDSVFMTARINKLKSDSSFYVGRISKLSNDSAFLSGRISKLSYDSIIYVGRIYKLINDSNAFVTRINTLKTDSINNKNTINLLNADISTKGNIITYLQNDTTSKGNTIRSLQLALLNKHDTLYVGSVVSTDTLKISIHTGLSTATPLVNILKVYPNPASSILHIDLEKPGYYTARISSLSGQTTITPTSGSIDISSLASGVYVLTIYDSKDKLLSTNKIMIVR